MLCRPLRVLFIIAALFQSLFCLSYRVVVVRWLGGSFAFLPGFVWLGKCKCATKSVGSLVCYFNNFRLSTSCNMLICWMAILLSFISRSFCGIFSLMKTAFKFSIFERQISSLIMHNHGFSFTNVPSKAIGHKFFCSHQGSWFLLFVVVVCFWMFFCCLTWTAICY